MKAFAVDRYGKKMGLRLADMPRPELREDEVLVQVHAAGVNLRASAPVIDPATLRSALARTALPSCPACDGNLRKYRPQ